MLIHGLFNLDYCVLFVPKNAQQAVGTWNWENESLFRIKYYNESAAHQLILILIQVPL